MTEEDRTTRLGDLILPPILALRVGRLCNQLARESLVGHLGLVMHEIRGN